MQEPDCAYVAAVVDSLAVLTTRKVASGYIPVLTIQGKHQILPWLAEVTGVSLMTLNKSYERHVCTEHCPDKHQNVETWTQRWQLSGARATVVLQAIRPYLRLQQQDADRLINLGMEVDAKPATLSAMIRLGWDVPQPQGA